MLFNVEFKPRVDFSKYLIFLTNTDNYENVTNLSLVPRPILRHTEAFFCLFLFSFHPEIHHLPRGVPKNNETYLQQNSQ